MPFYSGYGKIKRSWTDQLFSNFIRERSNWQCQNPKCEKKFDPKKIALLPLGIR